MIPERVRFDGSPPYEILAGTVERTGLVRALSAAFENTSGRQRIVRLTGLAGAGKTVLALQFAKYAAHRFDRITYTRLRSDLVRDVWLRRARSEDLFILDDVTTEVSGLPIGRVFQNLKRPSMLLVGRQFRWPMGASPSTVNVAGLSALDAARLFEMRMGRPGRGIEIDQLVARFEGNVGRMSAALQILSAGLGTWSDVLGRMEPLAAAGLLGPSGQPLDPNASEYRAIVADVKGVSLDLLKRLARNPEELYKMGPRFFEEVVTELFRRKGYEVILTPSQKDGGKDIYAVRRDSIGTFLTLVECKRYAPDNPVGVELVRSLYGVVEEERASAGILATTSYFTAGAKAFQHKVKFRIGLQDFVGLQNLLRDIAGT